MIKKSAFEGNSNRAPMNSRAMSTSSDVTVQNVSETQSQVWFDSNDFQSAVESTAPPPTPPLPQQPLSFGSGIDTRPAPLPQQAEYMPPGATSIARHAAD